MSNQSLYVRQDDQPLCPSVMETQLGRRPEPTQRGTDTRQISHRAR